MTQNAPPTLLQLREALEASWSKETAYLAVKKKGNPALGQCYPTSRVVQHYFPDTEIIKGVVWNGKEIETHFWNGLKANGILYHIDLSWQQFPAGSVVKSFRILDRNTLGDSEATVKRCKLLLEKVANYLTGINNN
jgi:hypothetical protein